MMIKIKCFYDVFKSNDLFRNFVFLDDKNEIIAINIDYCKDNTICLQYL